MISLHRFRDWWTYESPWGRSIVRIQAWICGESPVEVECRDEQAQQMRRTTEVRR